MTLFNEKEGGVKIPKIYSRGLWMTLIPYLVKWFTKVKGGGSKCPKHCPRVLWLTPLTKNFN